MKSDIQTVLTALEGIPLPKKDEDAYNAVETILQAHGWSYAEYLDALWETDSSWEEFVDAEIPNNQGRD